VNDINILEFINEGHIVYCKNKEEVDRILTLFEKNNCEWVNKECSNWRNKATTMQTSCKCESNECYFYIDKYSMAIKHFGLQYALDKFNPHTTKIIDSKNLI